MGKPEYEEGRWSPGDAEVEKVVGGIGMERSVRRKESLSLFTQAILGTTASIE